MKGDVNGAQTPHPGHNKSALISTKNNKLNSVLAKNSASYTVSQPIPVAV
jgi:hypothetical protein